MAHRRFILSALIVAATAIGVYCLRSGDARAIEGFPSEMRALATLRTAHPTLQRTVRDLARFRSLPPDAQRAALTECHLTPTPEKRVRDCLFDDADHVDALIAQRTTRRMLGFAALSIAFVLLVLSITNAVGRASRSVSA